MKIYKLIPIGALLGTGLMVESAQADSIEFDTLENATALQQYYAELYNNALGDTPAAEQRILEDAQKKLTEDTVTLNALPRSPQTTYSSTVKVSDLWLRYYNNYINATTLKDKQSAKKMLETIADNEAASNKFVDTGLDKKKQYDPNKLPEDMSIKLNKYFVSLVNSMHTQMGSNKTAYFNNTSKDFATAVANGYTSANFVADSGHSLEAINSAAIKNGLVANPLFNQYENLTTAFVTSKKAPTFTEAQLYKMIYDSFLNFSIYDVYSNFNHLKSLIDSPTMGLALSNVSDRDGWKHIQLHVLSVQSPALLVRPAEYNSSYGIKSSTTNKPFANQASAQVSYDSNVVAVSSAQRAYSSASADKSFAASKANNSLTSANIQLSLAQSAYDSSLANAQSSSSSQPSSSSSTQSSSSSVAPSSSSTQSSSSSVAPSSSSTQSSSSSSTQSSSSSSTSSSGGSGWLDEPIVVELEIIAELWIQNS